MLSDYVNVFCVRTKETKNNVTHTHSALAGYYVLLYDGQCLNLLTTEYNKAPSYSVELTRGGIAQSSEWE